MTFTVAVLPVSRAKQYDVVIFHATYRKMCVKYLFVRCHEVVCCVDRMTADCLQKTLFHPNDDTSMHFVYCRVPDDEINSSWKHVNRTELGGNSNKWRLLGTMQHTSDGSFQFSVHHR